jgi:hypothetical protein
MRADSTQALEPYLRLWGNWRSNLLTRKLSYPHRSPEQVLARALTRLFESDEDMEKIDEALTALFQHHCEQQAQVLLQAYVHRRPIPRRYLDPAVKTLAAALSWT